jgi:hypothetical protein
MGPYVTHRSVANEPAAPITQAAPQAVETKSDIAAIKG